MTRNQSRLCVAHESDLAAIGVQPKALYDCPQDRVGADQTSLAGDDGRRVDACEGYELFLPMGEQISDR